MTISRLIVSSVHLAPRVFVRRGIATRTLLAPRVFVRRGIATRTLLAVALVCAVASCDKAEPGELVSPKDRRTFEAPLEEPGAWCSDLRNARICFAEPCPGGVCVFPAPSPAEGSREYRCTGVGAERVCRLRSELASPFVCARRRCTQNRPRMPDDGDWECADAGGAVLCRGGQQPAGVFRAQHDAGWWCGGRRGKARERLCIDVDPDFPPSPGSRWECHFAPAGPNAIRVCVPSERARLGDVCNSHIECPLGAQCARNTCIPRVPTPNCWTGTDCATGRCELGVCVEESG